ncbi:MAG: fructose-specific PTS transporter subunit EIIC [Coprobacillus sp.]
MNIRDLLKRDSVILNVHSETKEEALEKLVIRHFETGHVNNQQKYMNAIIAREGLSSTGVGNMIAIPHAQDDSVNYPSLVAMVDKEGVDFNSLDYQPAKIFFMIAVPKDGGSQHLEILAKLCQILMDEKIIKQLLKAGTAQQFIDILTSQMEEEMKEDIKTDERKVDLVAVTACPTGIAHTYMAAKALEEAATQMGIQIKVETNGASGIKNRLTDKEINDAKCIIVAADKKVELPRFHGKNMIQVPVAKGIHEARELLEKAMNGETQIYNSQNNIEDVNETNIIRIFYKHLMNGISNIIPILIISGILVTSILLAGTTGLFDQALTPQKIQFILSCFQVLKQFSLAILAAFIADSISEKPGMLVAFMVSLLALYLQQGIIEVIIVGFAIGYFVKILQKIFSYLPDIIDSIIPNLLIPIFGSIAGCGLVFILSQLDMNSSLIMLLTYDTNQIGLIVGIVLGIMMSIDMGGPINKTAYTLGIISFCVIRGDIMSAVMLAGMIPPIVIWLSMLIIPSRFSNQQKEGKWRCLIKGLCFVSEEAIPYMSSDRIGIHVPCIIASGVAGGLAVFFGCGQLFPHGGIFVLPLIQQPLHFLLAMFISTIVGVLLVVCFRKVPKQ